MSRILLFEDLASDAAFVQGLIAQGGGDHQAVCVKTLAEGFVELSQDTFDVILLDLGLADSQGLETFHRLYDRSSRLPIIILSRLEDEQIALAAVQKGAQDYVVKGRLNAKALARIIRYAIERKKFDQLKDDFLHIVSHELRNPVTILKLGLSELALPHAGSLTPKQADLIARLKKHADRMSHIIGDMLDLARLESGKASVQVLPHNVSDLMARALDGLEILCQQKDIVLVQEVAGRLPDVLADADFLIQTVNNLVSNAMRFARRRILIAAKAAGSQICFSVIDDGPGISPADRGALFNKFVQLGRKLDVSGYKGTGLGLALCKQLVELQGGKIWVDGEEGQGAQFHFTLPMQQPSTL